MLPRITSITVSEGVAVDAFSGRITLFNMQDGLIAASFPAFAPRVFFVVCYEFDDEESSTFTESFTVAGAALEETLTWTGSIGRTTRFHQSIHPRPLRIGQEGEAVIELKLQEEGNESVVTMKKTIVFRAAVSPMMPQ